MPPTLGQPLSGCGTMLIPPWRFFHLDVNLRP
jgi:hypothetical protein